MVDSTDQRRFTDSLRRLLRVSKRELEEQERKEQAAKRRRPPQRKSA